MTFGAVRRDVFDFEIDGSTMSEWRISARLRSIGRILTAVTHDAVRRTVRRRVLVLGDSHVRVFEHWWFLARMPRVAFVIEYVPGGTAIGILNPKSQSGARQRFEAALAQGPWERVVVGLGEVDVGFTLWRMVEFRGQKLEVALERSLERYFTFLGEVAAVHDLVVLAATLPTVDDYSGSDALLHRQRDLVAADRRARTDLTLVFNERVASWCRARGIPHLDSAEVALGADRLIRPDWIRRDDRRDNHCRREPFARWLAGAFSRLPPPAGSARNETSPTSSPRAGSR